MLIIFTLRDDINYTFNSVNQCNKLYASWDLITKHPYFYRLLYKQNFLVGNPSFGPAWNAGGSHNFLLTLEL